MRPDRNRAVPLRNISDVAARAAAPFFEQREMSRLPAPLDPSACKKKPEASCQVPYCCGACRLVRLACVPHLQRVRFWEEVLVWLFGEEQQWSVEQGS